MHVVDSVQDAAFAVALNVPAGQASHVRSAVALPGALTYVPGAQFDHARHIARFSVALKLLLGQAAHVRSAFAEGAFNAWVPAAHVDHAAQAVEGSPSSSQVPGVHGPGGEASGALASTDGFTGSGPALLEGAPASPLSVLHAATTKAAKTPSHGATPRRPPTARISFDGAVRLRISLPSLTSGSLMLITPKVTAYARASSVPPGPRFESLKRTTHSAGCSA